MEIQRRLEVNGINTDVECDPTNVELPKWLASIFNNHKTMDWYTKSALWLYWKRGDDEEVLTYDEFSDLEEENLREDTEIAEIFRIETNIFDFETPLCKEFKEFNHLFPIDIDNKEVSWVKENPWLDNGTWKKPNDDICHECKPFKFKSGYWYEGLEDGDLKDEALKEKPILEGSWGHEDRKGKNFCSWLKEKSSEDDWSNYLPNDDNDAIQANQERFDNHEPVKDDNDDIGDLNDYLIPRDASYYVDEGEERLKERKSKLLRIPYEKPPTSKSKKFEVIKYSLGPAEEYIAIKEYQYDIWVRTE
ncbi:hypothetical protein Tco_0453769 [Tanacetum coccineum]